MSDPISLFTKPWNDDPDAIGAMTASYGFDAVELPVRPGLKITPANVRTELPKACAALEAHGITVTSIASDLTEDVFAACAECGVPLIRVMADVTDAIGYMDSEGWWARKLRSVTPLCEKYGVMIGVQQHHGAYVATSMELRRLIESVNSPWVGAVWDAAHSALAGERPAYAIDILWDYLFMVNFKNACYTRTAEPSTVGSPKPAQYGVKFVKGLEGMADWNEAVRELVRRGYEGTVCMHPEYTDEAMTANWVADDLKYLKLLIRKASK